MLPSAARPLLKRRARRRPLLYSKALLNPRGCGRQHEKRQLSHGDEPADDHCGERVPRPVGKRD